jgi:dihydropyrimidinase
MLTSLRLASSRGLSALASRSFSAARQTQPLVIRNGTVVNHDGMFKADVLTVGGKIEKVGIIADTDVPADAREIDATGRYVIPGGIDTHTHLEMPFMGTTTIDDYHYGTQAAVAGGTTTLMDFVIPGRGQSMLEAHDQWVAKATPKINCDVAFHMAVTWFSEQVLEEMDELTNKRGINSYKFFLAYNNVLRMYDDELLKIFARCKELGALAQVHAENGDMVDAGQQAMIDAGITGPEGHPMSRPEATEAEATHRAIAIADQVNVPLYVVHVMSKAAAFEVARAKEAGMNVYGEPLAVALAVDGREQYHPDWRHAAGHVMSPPLREDPTTKHALIRALKDGALDCVGTDNATFSSNQKALGKDDFRKIPNGTNGIEDRMSVVWHKGVKGLDMTPSEFVKVTSTKAAMLFNMYPRKGRIAEGCDADIVIWDGDNQRTVSKDTHHHAVDFNVFEGMTFYGIADKTISGGRVVWEDGELCTENGWGQIVDREPFGYAYRDQFSSEHSKDPARKRVEREPYLGPVIQV